MKNIKALLKKVKIWLQQPIQLQTQSLSRRYYVIENFLFKKKYSLDFDGLIPCSELVVESEFSKKNATAYEAYGSHYFKSLLRHAISMEKQPKYFIDVGCGKGKQCIYAKKYFNFEKVIGIDFSKELIDIAKKNLCHLNYENIDFFVADAVDWELPDEYCFVFLYNPFNDVILEKFIKKNIDHFKKNGSIVCYANDLYRKPLMDAGFEILYRDHDSNSIHKFV
jgi:SAM-dependent methyltransferase